MDIPTIAAPHRDHKPKRLERGRLERDAVLAALAATGPGAVLDQLGFRWLPLTAGELAFGPCPWCGERGPVVMTWPTGTWTCRANGCRGRDLLTLIGAAEGLDKALDFLLIVARAAQLAGLPHCPSADAIARARDRAERTWTSLARADAAGEQTLRQRGLEAVLGVDAARFDGEGRVVLPLRDGLGRIVNLATMDEASSRLILLHNGSLVARTFGSLVAVGRAHGPVFVGDGAWSFLASLIRFGARGWAVIASPFTSSFAHTTRMVARACPGRPLVVVPQADEVGEAVVGEALAAALAEGASAEVFRDSEEER